MSKSFFQCTVWKKSVQREQKMKEKEKTTNYSTKEPLIGGRLTYGHCQGYIYLEEAMTLAFLRAGNPHHGSRSSLLGSRYFSYFKEIS